MTSGYQRTLQEGIQTAIQQGLGQGLEQGQRLNLLQLLKKRFTDEFAFVYKEKTLSANLTEINQ